MKVHKFTCENEHVFFIPFTFPISALDLAKMLNAITCPLCQSEFPLRIHAQEMKVEVPE